MKKLKVWGRPSSTNTQKVLWMIEECRESPDVCIDAQLIHASGWLGPGKNTFDDSSTWDKIVLSDSYREKNPNPTVPTIECELPNGQMYSLWESNSIVRYLAMCFRPDLYGNGSTSAEKACTASKWMDWQLQTNLTGRGKGLIIIDHAVRLPPAQRDMAILSAAAKEMGSRLAPVEFQLSKTKYLGGEEFSVGDIPVGVFVNRWKLAIEKGKMISKPGNSVDFSEVKETPHIDRWYKLLMDRPAFIRGCYTPEQLHMELPTSAPFADWLRDYNETYQIV